MKVLIKFFLFVAAISLLGSCRSRSIEIFIPTVVNELGVITTTDYDCADSTVCQMDYATFKSKHPNCLDIRDKLDFNAYCAKSESEPDTMKMVLFSNVYMPFFSAKNMGLIKAASPIAITIIPCDHSECVLPQPPIDPPNEIAFKLTKSTSIKGYNDKTAMLIQTETSSKEGFYLAKFKMKDVTEGSVLEFRKYLPNKVVTAKVGMRVQNNRLYFLKIK